MKITWEVSDGYIGKSRPQYTEVPNDELAKCETEEEREELIEEYIQNDFQESIGWEITSRE